jgi:sugar O-acyltransferase (sialic acid O-acetyltransferase NeuD family)
MALYGVYGAGGCGRGILPIVRDQLETGDRLVFVDDKGGPAVNGHQVVSFADFLTSDATEKRICIAVANGAIRSKLAEQSGAAGLKFFSVHHDNCIKMDDVEIGEGALFSPFTTVTSNVRIGRHFHCNLYSYVEHDCVIGDFVTFAPAVRCNGNVMIGDGAYIGAGAVIRQGLAIGAGATIGMGAVVTKDVPAGETWVGNPARPISAKPC